MALNIYMKKLITNKIIVIVIIIIAVLTRIWNLSNLPKSLSMDEVTFGSAAYSVLTTGMDEYGRFLPLSFKGMGDYKPPLDVYFKIPLIYIFGLNEFSVRLLGVILGSLTVLFGILFLRKLDFSDKASILTGFWLAISGWHIFYSRAGYEAITALFFLILGLYFFVSWIKDKKLLSFVMYLISFSLSAWAYHAERLFIPILFIALIIVFKSKFIKLFKNKRSLIVSLLIISFFVIPFLIEALVFKGIAPRANNLLFTKDLINPNFLEIVKSFIGQYLKYFDFKFVFWKSLGLTPTGYPDISILTLFDSIILFFGLKKIIKSKTTNSTKIAGLILFLGPLPSAFARGDASPIRILLWVPLFLILLAYGFEYLLKEKVLGKIAISIWFVGSLFYYSYFMYLYTNDFDKYYGDLWHYGYKEASEYLCQNYQKYDKIILTDKYGIEIPKIKTIPNYYVLFYCKKDPRYFNIEIRQPQWRIDSKNKNWLLVGSNWDFPENFDQSRVMKKIYFPNGKEALYFVETNEK